MRIPCIRELKKQLVMKYASNCIKIHCVGLLPVAVCAHMNDSIVWDRALCCSVPVYKATLILHKYLTAFWDVWDFFLSNVPFLFLCNHSLNLHVLTMVVTMWKCSCHFTKFYQTGEGEKGEENVELENQQNRIYFLSVNCALNTRGYGFSQIVL